MKPAIINGRTILTYEDYAAIPADGKVHQLIQGEEIVTPAPYTDHQAIIINLIRILLAHVDAGRLGKVYASPIDVVLTRSDVVQPDVLFIRKDHLAIVRKPYIEGAPDLIVEVLSPSKRKLDLGDKKDIYELHAVLHYWVVDPESRDVLEFCTEGGRYGEPKRHTKVFKPAIFPGLQIDVAKLFA